MTDGEQQTKTTAGRRLTKEARIQTVCLVILAVLACGAALYWLESMLVPFVLALFIAISLNPLVDLLIRRLKLPRTVAVVVTLVVGFCILGAVGVLVWPYAWHMRAERRESTRTTANRKTVLPGRRKTLANKG